MPEEIKDYETELKTNREIERTFDLWVLNFDIKDGCGGRPSFESLIYAFKFVGKQFIQKTLQSKKQEIIKEILKFIEENNYKDINGLDLIDKINNL